MRLDTQGENFAGRGVLLVYLVGVDVASYEPYFSRTKQAVRRAFVEGGFGYMPAFIQSTMGMRECPCGRPRPYPLCFRVCACRPGAKRAD